eukprot:Tamp_35937.p4 GENE.Tamp_35937~~Tamp_35937.p4  ORF type:complete len:115 (-),score=14.42 Tamp_35937:33-377(-)
MHASYVCRIRMQKRPRIARLGTDAPEIALPEIAQPPRVEGLDGLEEFPLGDVDEFALGDGDELDPLPDAGDLSDDDADDADLSLGGGLPDLDVPEIEEDGGLCLNPCLLHMLKT